MKPIILLHCLLLFAVTRSLGQFVELPVLRTEAEKAKGLYRYDHFKDGTIVFRNGIITPARFNYNITLDEMHFINQQGDTLSVSHPENINLISIDGTRFYFDQGYLQALKETNGIILAFRQMLSEEAPTQKAIIVADGDRDQLSNKNFFTGNGQKYVWANNSRVEIRSNEEYYFGDATGKFVKASKSFILDHFSHQQAAIKIYLKENHVSFNRQQDLVKLMEYCSSIVL